MDVTKIQVGDLVKTELSPGKHGARWTYDDHDGKFIDNGYSGDWAIGRVTTVDDHYWGDSPCMKAEIFEGEFKGAYFRSPLPGHQGYSPSFYDEHPGFLEFVKRSSPGNHCECGKDAANDSGAHSSWCPKYEAFGGLP